MPRAASIPIAVRGVVKRYAGVAALDHVDLDVKSGEFLTLLGPSGSGKSTLLMVLAGFIRPDDGSVRFGEREVIRLAPHKRDVGMVFQNYALFPHLDVAANIAFPLRLRNVATADVARRVEAALDMVQLGGLGTRRVHELSGGQRQRVALARAIVFEPRIVLMDEPLSALDKQLRDRMQIELRQLHDKLGMTTIYVTHDQREALTMSDRIAVIAGGKVQQVDTPRGLYERPANRFVAEFIGESTLLEIEMRDGACHCAGVRLDVAALPADGPPRHVLLRPERVRLGAVPLTHPEAHPDAHGEVRPEALPGHASGRHNTLEARVTDVIYQGDTFLVQATLANGARISARGIADAAALAAMPARGDTASFTFAARDTVVLAGA